MAEQYIVRSQQAAELIRCSTTEPDWGSPDAAVTLTLVGPIEDPTDPPSESESPPPTQTTTAPVPEREHGESEH